MLSPEWDFWAVVDRDLDELRAAYGITPLRPAHAAAGEEVVVADKADPYAT